MFKVGDKINNDYLLISHIATGGSSYIYKAKNLKTKKKYAIKIMIEKMLENEIGVRHFIREAKIVSNLSHKNIISIYELGVYQNYFYIVTELIEGQSLATKIQNNDISYLQACEILVQMCDALDYIHTRSIVHRDIKPDNIYLLKDNTVKLGDFGISLDLTNKNKNDLLLAGSIHYLSPEILQNKIINKLSDIYSLGITFYEMITKKLPFVSNDNFDIAKDQINKDIPLPSTIVDNLPKEIENIILKLTMKNQYDRYQDVKEVKNDLLSFIAKVKTKKNLFKNINIY